MFTRSTKERTEKCKELGGVGFTFRDPEIKENKYRRVFIKAHADWKESGAWGAYIYSPNQN